jgi:hypothetical protein
MQMLSQFRYGCVGVNQRSNNFPDIHMPLYSAVRHWLRQRACVAVVFLARLRYLWALVLSLIAHMLLILAIGPSSLQGGMDLNQQASTEILTVYLNRLGSTGSSTGSELFKHGNNQDKSTVASSNKLAQHANPQSRLADSQALDVAPASTGAPQASQISQQSSEKTPLLPILGLPKSHYFRSKELTEKPRILHDVFPDLMVKIPDISPQPAVLRLLINEQGDIDQVEIEESQFPKDVERLIIDNFSRIKFQPGRLGDLPVKSQLRIEVSLENALVEP